MSSTFTKAWQIISSSLILTKLNFLRRLQSSLDVEKSILPILIWSFRLIQECVLNVEVENEFVYELSFFILLKSLVIDLSIHTANCVELHAIYGLLRYAQNKMLVNKVPTNWNERNSIRKVFEVKCSAKLDNRLIRICIYTWTKIITVKPRANHTIRFSFMYSTNFSLHPVFLASLMVHWFEWLAGQHVYGNLFCPNIGYQSAGSFTPQHWFCNQFAYWMKRLQLGN